jgi:hypothetical protein
VTTVKYRNSIRSRTAAVAVEAAAIPDDAVRKTLDVARAEAPVDTGHLRDSIREEDGEAHVGGGDVDYAQLQDRGTVNTPPTFFWTHAVEAGKKRFEELSAANLATARKR